MSFYRENSIIRIDHNRIQETTDYIVEEYPLQIYVNNRRIITISCSPENLKELAAGYLYSKKIINKTNDIISVSRENNLIYFEIERNNKKLDITQDKNNIIPGDIIKKNRSEYGCREKLGDKKRNSKELLSTSDVFLFVDKLYKKAEIFHKTGAVHNALLITPGGKEVVFREDIGRHNTVDKIMGNILLNKLSAENKIMVISGRISCEIVNKAVRAGLPVIISPSPPTDLAIKRAADADITIIGFVREGKMNIYTGKQRVRYKELTM